MWNYWMMVARQVRREVKFSTAGMLFAMAISLGLAFAIVAVTRSWQTPPIDHSAQLFWLQQHDVTGGGIDPTSLEDISELHADLLSVGGYIPPSRRGQPDFVRLPDRKAFVKVAQVNPELLGMLGNRPQLGRQFAKGDQSFTYDFFDTVILSWSAWQRLCGGRPDVIGSYVFFQGKPYPEGASLRVVGVLPRAAVFPADADLFVPLPRTNDPRIPHNSIHALLQLKEVRNTTYTEESIERLAISRGWSRATGTSVHTFELRPIFNGAFDAYSSTAARALSISIGVCTVLFVTLILIALLRLRRQADFVVVSLTSGATRRQLFTRNLLAGAALALGPMCVTIGAYAWATYWLVHRFSAAGPSYWHLTSSTSIGIAAASCCFFGIVAWNAMPLLVMVQNNQAVLLKQFRQTQTVGSLRWSTGLLALIVFATSVVVAMASGSILRFEEEQRDADGFDLRNLYEMTCVIPNDGAHTYSGNGMLLQALASSLRDKYHSNAAVSIFMPNEAGPIDSPIAKTSDDNPHPIVNLEGVTPDFFKTVGLKILRGRDYTLNELQDMNAGGAQPMVVDANVVAHLHLSPDAAVGTLVHSPGSKDFGAIVGVVSGITSAHEVLPTVYVPLPDLLPGNTDLTFHVFLRSPGNPITVGADLSRTLKGSIPSLETNDLVSAEDLFPLDYQMLRLEARLSELEMPMALLAMAIAVASVMVWIVILNQRAVAIRVSMGASLVRAYWVTVRPPLIAAICSGFIASEVSALFLRSTVRSSIHLQIFASTIILFGLLGCCLLAIVGIRSATSTDELLQQLKGE